MFSSRSHSASRSSLRTSALFKVKLLLNFVIYLTEMRVSNHCICEMVILNLAPA